MRMQLSTVFAYNFFFQAEDGIRDADVTGVQTCALPISAIEILTLILLFGEKALFDTDPFRLILTQLSEGKDDVRQLFLRESVEEIGLILLRIRSLFEQITVSGLLYSCIVTCGKLIELDTGFASDLRKCTELDETVAPYAGIRCTTCQILVSEVLENDPLILSCAIEYMILYTEHFTYSPRFCDILLFVGSETGILPELTREGVPLPP